MHERRRQGIGSSSLKMMLAAYERQLIQSALQAASGNQRRAAALLGLLPTTLHEKMKRLGLVRRERTAVASPEEEEMVSELR